MSLAQSKEIRFDKYRLLERISHGGMAEVFRAKTFGAAGFEREVAIKLLLPSVAMDRDFITMLIDEAKIAGQLSHANIAQIFDLGSAEGRYYIVQEYIRGKDLRGIIRHCRTQKEILPVEHGCHIMLKVCEGLDYAHNKRDPNGQPLNLVHRDVSPQNVLVSMDGEVKLIDFGIAKAEGRATRTLAGLVKGKFAYMSPEQIRGLPVDRRSDVFACGIVFHELLTCKPLFLRKSEFETLKRARSGDIPPPSELNPLVPKELDAITLKALTRHVDDRYQSAQEMREALWDFVKSDGRFYSQGKLADWMQTTFGPPDDATQTQAAGTTERDKKVEPFADSTENTANDKYGLKPGQLRPGDPKAPAFGTSERISFGGSDQNQTVPDVRPGGRGFSQLEDTTDVDKPKKPSFARIETAPRFGGLPAPGARPPSGNEMELLLDDPGKVGGPAPEPDTTKARKTVDNTASDTTASDSTNLPTNRALVNAVRARHAPMPGSAMQPPPGSALQPPPGSALQPPPGSALQPPPGPHLAGMSPPPPADVQRAIAYQGRTSRHSMLALKQSNTPEQGSQQPTSKRRTNLLVAAAIFLLLIAGAASIALALIGGDDDSPESEQVEKK